MESRDDMLAHLERRGVSMGLYTNSIVVDKDAVTFLLWNPAGLLTGYQRYNPDGHKGRPEDPYSAKYYSFFGERGLMAWGIESLYWDYYDAEHNFVCLVEGVFDAAWLHTLGYRALAVLSNDPKPLEDWLKRLPVTTLAVCDGDDGGQRLAKYADMWVACPPGVDPNDMTAEGVYDMLGRKNWRLPWEYEALMKHLTNDPA